MELRAKAVVLAAGKGTRLQIEGCDLPKVMRTAQGKPLLHYVLEALSFLEKEDIIIVAGYKREKVTAYFQEYPFAFQEEQLGTGHAVASAKEALDGFDGPVLVCCGDMPLITRDTYYSLLETHIREKNDCTMLTGTSDVDLPYGRIVRDGQGAFLRVVEAKDCTPEQARIRELNSGVYVFESSKLIPALSQLRNDNAQGEYYLTDVPDVLRTQGGKVDVCCRDLGHQIIGVNTVEQLRRVEELLSK